MGRKTKHTAFASTFIAAALTLGCSDSSEAPAVGDAPETGVLAPPASGEGLQYKMVTHVDPGSEVEHCQFVKAPAEGMWINGDEVRYPDGTSHHFLLLETTYTEIPTEKLDGTKVDTRGVFDCTDGPSNGWSIRRVLGGSQSADAPAAIRFPDHVGMYVEPGQVLMMNAHIINTTKEHMESEVRINLYTIPDEQAEIEGDVLFWYNIFIKADAMGTGRARMRCEIHDDITLINAQSHMHQRGVDFQASIVGGDVLYENTEWEEVPVKVWDDGGLDIAGGSVIDYQCDYENHGAEDVYQGPRSSDEMCMFVGAYYPVNRHTSLCSIAEEDAEETAFIGADWVGNGSTSCRESFFCANKAADDFEGLTDCMLDADPKVAEMLSDALRCSALHGDEAGACDEPFQACLAN